jgi:crotonobetainyl-CoA:carnitine CoA-transferase CaiB-like acyl-CoA transferase
MESPLSQETMESPLSQKTFEADQTGPLDGLRILDLTRVVAGNTLTHFLADFGAEVLKIETPGKGDDLRGWQTNDVQTWWKVYSRNKKSVTLNLRADAGKELLLKLVGTADVLIENFRAGMLEKIGLAPERLHQENPKLIIVRISGWGQDGPFKHKPGFGTLIEGMSGFASVNGFPDRPPVLPQMALADMVAGLYGASAVLTAIRNIETLGGQGQVIDLPLFDPLHSILGPLAANFRVSGKVPERTGSRLASSGPRNAYQTKDNHWLAMSATTQGTWENLARSIDREDLIDDPRFKTNPDRVNNAAPLDDAIGAWIGEHTRAENLDYFDKAGITVGPICTIADLMDHHYIAEREVLVELPDEDMGSIPMHNVVPRLSKTPGTFRRPAPKLGEHTDEILDDLGIDEGARGALREDGVI